MICEFFVICDIQLMVCYYYRALQLLSSGLNLAIKQITDGNLKPSDNVKNGEYYYDSIEFGKFIHVKFQINFVVLCA